MSIRNIFYRYRIDIYRLATQPNDIASYIRADNTTYALVSSNVPALYWSAPETVSPSNLGRLKDDDKISLERVKVAADVDIDDGDVIVFTSPSSFPYVNQCFSIKGDAQTHTSLIISDCKTYFLVSIPTPNGIVLAAPLPE